MEKRKSILFIAGVMSFILSVFQGGIGFSPSLSLYFGAPESLVNNPFLLIITSLFIAVLLAVFGWYAISGAGYFSRLPWLKQILVVICCIYLLRSLFIIPEILVVMGVIETSVLIPIRFILFSIGSLIIGFMYLMGIIGGWNTYLSNNRDFT